MVNGEWQLVLPLSPSTVYILAKSYANLAVQSCFISIQMCKLTFTSRSLISNFHSGSFNGCFSKVHPAELGGTAIKEVLARADVKGEDVCEVIMGNVGQVYSKTFSIVFLSSSSLSFSPGTASWFETEPGTPSLLQRGHPTGRACFRPEHVVWLWSKVHSTRLPGDSQWRGKDRGERRTGEHDQSASYDPVA